MSTFEWMLVAVGGFLVLSAVGTLFRAGKDGERRKESIGCGFMFVAALFWGVALARYLGDWSAGMRLGVALALLLPVLATLVNRRGGRMLASIVLLTAAVALGASAVPKLLEHLRPPRWEVTLGRTQAAVADLGKQIESTRAYIKKLGAERDALKRKIRELGFTNFAAIANDPRGFALLTELGEVDRMAAAAQARLVEREALLLRMEAAERQIRRRADAQATGVEFDETEIAAILDQAKRPPAELGPATVEEHVARERLKQLFEREF